MSVTCIFNGRLGNCLYNISQIVAHCKRHDLQWYFPVHAWACAGGQVPITVPNTASQLPFQPMVYDEPIDADGYPYYKEIPVKDNILFRGYFQSFQYFDDYREQILEVLNFPWELNKGVVGIHCRFGDCIPQPDAFPIAPWEYYQKAIEYMKEKGYTHFKVFSDTMDLCKEHFTGDRYPGITIEFIEGNSEVTDFKLLSNCESIITARSTFSLMAGYFNRYENKIVLCPSGAIPWWVKQNKNFFTGTEHWLTQLSW